MTCSLVARRPIFRPLPTVLRFMSTADFIDLKVLSRELLLDSDEAGPKHTTSLHARRTPLAAPAAQFGALNAAELTSGPTGTGNFAADLAASGWPSLNPAPLETFQINVGKLCNMTCRHCHVDSGPDRTDENMNRTDVDACLAAIDHILASPDSALHTVDLTGGAPELNPHFEYLVDACVARGLHVIDRCNLTILLVRRYEHLPQWMAERGVEVACSLPHYRKLGTDAQRGDGTYEKSIRALRRLNEAGYGQGDPERVLTLVTNPRRRVFGGQPGLARRRVEGGAAEEPRRDVRPAFRAQQHADVALPRMAAGEGHDRGVYGAPHRGVQPGHDRRADVPQHDLGGVGRQGVRLRLQPAARDGRRRPRSRTSATSTSATGRTGRS